MSSTADSLKNSAETTGEEPNVKKAKLADTDEQLKSVDNNNGTVGENNDLESGANNNKTAAADDATKASGSSTNNIPTKSANGTTDKDLNKSEQDTGDDGDGSDVFDPKIAGKLEEVEDIQTQISKLNELASEEIVKVEQKYNKLRKPHYEKRNTILKEVPNFWVTTLANHPLIAPMIDRAEVEDCLHYMVNLDVEEYEDIKSGYKLFFHFVENPYIENDVLIKDFSHVSDDIITVSSTKIQFKNTSQGERLKHFVEVEAPAQNRRKDDLGQVVTFFSWLGQSNSDPGTDEIAEVIKDQIWPSPLEFFFSAPDDYGGGSDESDDEDDYDEEADNDDVDVPEEELLDEDLDNEELDDEDELGDDDDDDDDDEEDDDEE